MNLHVDVLCNLIIQNYFFNSRCLTVFTDEGNTFEFKGSLPAVNVKIDNNLSLHTEIFLNYFGCQAILIKSNTPVTIFQEFEKEIKLSYERFNERKFIFAPGSNMTENLADIFLSTEISYVADLIIIEPKENVIGNKTLLFKNIETYELWTHKYKGSENNNYKEMLDIWHSGNQSFQFNRNLYPNKLKNQMGRLWTMAILHYIPYNIIEGRPIEEFKGIEMSAVLSFLKYVNMTPAVYFGPEGSSTDVFPNWTVNELVDILIEDRADIITAALCMWSYLYQYSDYSLPSMGVSSTVLVPKAQLAAGWLTPWYSYSNYMWCLVGATFILYTTIHFLFSLIKTKVSHLSNHQQRSTCSCENSLLIVFKAFLVQDVNNSYMPPGRNGTFFMGTLFVYTLFLSATYSSGLATVMTIPRYDHPIRTIEDLANSGLSWVATDESWTFSLLDSQDPLTKIIVSRFLYEPNTEKIREYSKTRDYAFAIERLPQNYYGLLSNIQRDVIENFDILMEDIFSCPLVILFRKSSILLPLFNYFYATVFEAGLFQYWQREAMDLFTDSYLQRVLKSTTKQQHLVGKLKWVHVEGAFGILIIGHAFAIIILLLEFATYHYGCHKSFSQQRQQSIN